MWSVKFSLLKYTLWSWIWQGENVMKYRRCVPLNKNIYIELKWEVLNVINSLQCYQNFEKTRTHKIG